MKIGLFTDGFEPQMSGLVVSIRMLRDALIGMGHEVFIITLDDRNQSLDEENILRIKGRTIPRKGLKEYRFRLRLKKKDLLNVEALNLDIIHVHTEFAMGKLGMKLSKKRNIPLIYTSHTMLFDYAHYVPFLFRPLVRRIMKKTSKKFHKRASTVIYPTKKVLTFYEGLIKFDYDYKIIPTGVKLANFTKEVSNEEIDLLKKEIGIDNFKHVALFLGRVTIEKNIDLLIRQFPKVNKDTCLVIVGEGFHMEKLKKMVANLNIENRVFFTGRVEWSKIVNYYKSADIFVNASTTETQGLTFIESLASGLPVVAKYDTNLDDVILDQVNGRFFKEENEFSEILNTIFNNNFEEMKNNTSKVISKYSQENYALNCLELYNNCKKNIN